MEEIKAKLKILLQTGLANPGPPVGPCLGSYGINLQAFCKEFNEKSLEKSNKKTGEIVTAAVTIYKDKKFSLYIKSTPTSLLIKKFLNLDKGSKEPKKQSVGTLTKEHIEEIVKIKKNELNTVDDKKAEKIIIGTALSMGILIKI